MASGMVTTTVLDEVDLDLVTSLRIPDVTNPKTDGVDSKGKLLNIVSVFHLFVCHFNTGQEMRFWFLAPVMQMCVVFL